MVLEPEIRPEDPCSTEATALVRALRDELVPLYPRLRGYAFDQADLRGAGSRFLVAWRGRDPVGCGGLRHIDASLAEVCRMYVVPEARGQGIGGLLLDRLEREARAIGYVTIQREKVHDYS